MKLSSVIMCAVGLACVQGGNLCATEKPYHNTQRGDWFTRVRALYILPDYSSGSLSSVPNSSVGVRPAWTGEFDFGYMFTKHLGSELILATSRHSIYGKKALGGVEVGKTWVLPPTLTLQWRFCTSSVAQPYIGAGGNYTLFYSEKSSIKGTHLKLSHSFGPALQAGMDVFFYKNWFINFDAKYIWIDTRANLHGTVKGHVNVDINPWVLGMGFGYKW